MGAATCFSVRDLRPALRVIGIDPSATLLRRATASGTAGSFARASAEALPFGDATFDLTMSLFAVKHWPNRLAGLAECVRVTRPGGTVLVTDIDATGDRQRWRAFVDETAMPRWARRFYVAATLRPIVGRATEPDLLRHELASVGLTNVEVRQDRRRAIVVGTATVAR